MKQNDKLALVIIVVTIFCVIACNNSSAELVDISVKAQEDTSPKNVAQEDIVQEDIVQNEAGMSATHRWTNARKNGPCYVRIEYAYGGTTNFVLRYRNDKHDVHVRSSPPYDKACWSSQRGELVNVIMEDVP